MRATLRRPIRRLVLGAVLSALFLAAPGAVASGRKLHLVPRLWGTGEARYVGGGCDELLERFPAPVGVRASEVSPDGRRAFVWYNEDRRPLKLAIYDLAARRRTARFAPGFGGDIHFTPGGNLVHDWGCGTNCANFRVYDPAGRTVLEAVSSWVEISPTHRFVLTAPSLYASTEPMVIYDPDTGRKVFALDPPRGGSFILDRVRWDDAKGVITLDLSYMHGRPRHVVVRVGKAVSGRRAR